LEARKQQPKANAEQEQLFRLSDKVETQTAENLHGRNAVVRVTLCTEIDIT